MEQVVSGLIKQNKVTESNYCALLLREGATLFIKMFLHGKLLCAEKKSECNAVQRFSAEFESQYSFGFQTM